MKKFLMLLAAVMMFAAPAVSLAQTLTDYEYSRLTFGNNFANQKVKPIILNADRGLHAPVSTLALLAAIEYGARYQGMMVNVDTGLYFYDATDCPGGSTSPTAVAPDDANGCWYLTSASADIWATLADTTPVSGASLIGIKDTATYYTGTDVETALAEIGAEFLTKQDLAVPAAVGNIATLDATGQVVDSGDLLSEFALLVGTPTNGNLVCTDALGQPYDCGSAPADYVTTAIITDAFEDSGLGIPKVDEALDGADFPAAPADGYRVFCTGTNGGYNEGYTYIYAAGTGYTQERALSDGYILQVKGNPPDFIIGGTALTDWVNLSDRPTKADLETYMGISNPLLDAALPFGSIPAAPADGYRVLATTTGGAFVQGKIYTYSTGGATYDAGKSIGDGYIVQVKGSSPDFVVGGTADADYVMLSTKAPYPSCKTITVALGASSGVTAADPDWVGATIYSFVPTSANDQPVASITVAGDGAVTLTTSAVETAEATFQVCTFL